MPHRLSFCLHQTTNSELSQASIAALCVGELRDTCSLGVFLLALGRPHPHSKRCHLWGISSLRRIRVLAFVKLLLCILDDPIHLRVLLLDRNDIVVHREATIDQIVLLRRVLVITDFLMHRSHLTLVAASLNNIHTDHHWTFPVGCKLHVKRWAKTTIGHLHTLRLRVGRGSTRLFSGRLDAVLFATFIQCRELLFGSCDSFYSKL